MKKKEIQQGQTYVAKVSGKLTTVRVDRIRQTSTYNDKLQTVYDVTNLATGRRTTFRSAAKFRSAWGTKTLKQAIQRSSNNTNHVIVEALAGTGKTFTMIVGTVHAFAPQLWEEFENEMQHRKNDSTLKIVPSQEQQKVWDALKEVPAKTITYCAFNRSIVGEFAETWGWLQGLLSKAGVSLKFSTVNALGYSTIRSTYGRVRVTTYHTENLLSDYLRRDTRELRRKSPVLVSAVCRLVSLVKLTLLGWSEKNGFNPDSITPIQLSDLASYYDVDTNGHERQIYESVIAVLKRSLDVKSTNEIDFDDQNWLPIVNNLPINKCDCIMVDEGQDLPRCKQEFVRRAGRRVILVGDANQAIYGFAGADTESIPRMRKLLNVSQPLYLTETRRCGRAIVTEANTALHSTIETLKAHADNPDGCVKTLPQKDYASAVKDGDMVLCRVNAPLVSNALRFIKDGRKALIRGREFGTELINFVKRLKATDINGLIQKTDDWYHKESMKESAKRNPSEARLIALEDRRDCINAFCEGATRVEEVIQKIETVFAGKQCPRCGKYYPESVDRCPNKDCKCESDPISGYPCGPHLVTPKGILFSSVHRAKGLEADNVYLLLAGGGIPHPMARSKWQVHQEWNLKYVAITRAIHNFTYVTGDPKNNG